MKNPQGAVIAVLLAITACADAPEDALDDAPEEAPEASFGSVEADGRDYSNVRLTLLGGKPSLVGGVVEADPDPVAVSTIWEWDEERGLEVSSRSLLTPRAYHSTFVLPDERVLVFGGQGDYSRGEGENPLTQEIEVLHPNGAPNESFGWLSEIRRHPLAHLEPEGTVLIFGGSFVVFSSAFERVDLVAKTVTPLYDELSRMYSDHCSVSLVPLGEGTYFLIGGLQQVAPDGYSYDCGGGAEIIDIATGEARFVGDDVWEIVAQGRRAVALPGGDVLVVGSRSATSGGPWLERFDPSSEQFTILAEGDVRVLYPAVIPLDDGRIFIIGSSPSPIATPHEDLQRTWYFDPSDDSLEEGPPLPAIFEMPQAVRFEDSRVFVLGTHLNHFYERFAPLELAVLSDPM